MRKKNNILLGPVITIAILTFTIMIISSICSFLGVDGEITRVTSGSLETSVVSVKSIISKEGLRYFFSSPIETFKNFKNL